MTAVPEQDNEESRFVVPETLSGEAWIALPIILAAVALVAGARSRPTIRKPGSS